MRNPYALSGVIAMILAASVAVSAQQSAPTQPAPNAQDTTKDAARQPDYVFDMGKIVVVGSVEGRPGVGGAVVTRDAIWNFDRKSLDHAVNMVERPAQRKRHLRPRVRPLAGATVG